MIFINPDFEKEVIERDLDIIAQYRYGKYYLELCGDKQIVVVNLHKSGFLNDLRKNGRVPSM